MIKLTGDVRVTWCAAFDEYLQAMLADSAFESILVDLSAAEGIDSTTLGMLAKLSIKAQQEFDYLPTIYSPDASITRLLESMSFDKVFKILSQIDEVTMAETGLTLCDCSEADMREKVIEAHRVLMGLSDENRVKFEQLVSTLEASIHSEH
nr:STAS domain-containing protein [Sinobacterium norvegicum]